MAEPRAGKPFTIAHESAHRTEPSGFPFGKDLRVLTGYRALVTGASGGLGLALAHALARRGAAVVVTARRGDRLRALAAELRATHGVEAHAVEADLGVAGGAARLWAAAAAIGPIDILVNNAGFGYFARFDAVEATRSAELIALNVDAPVALCHAFVAARPDGADRRGYILNVASTVAWQAIPHFAVYAASKAFVRSFSEALHVELRPRDVVVHCLCPGGTRTEFHAVAGAGHYGRLAEASVLDAATVAEAGVHAMLRARRTLVTGRMNKLATFVAHVAPRRLATWMSGRVLGRPRVGALPARSRSSAPAGDLEAGPR